MNNFYLYIGFTLDELSKKTFSFEKVQSKVTEMNYRIALAQSDSYFSRNKVNFKGLKKEIGSLLIRRANLRFKQKDNDFTLQTDVEVCFTAIMRKVLESQKI